MRMLSDTQFMKLQTFHSMLPAFHAVEQFDNFVSMLVSQPVFEPEEDDARGPREAWLTEAQVDALVAFAGIDAREWTYLQRMRLRVAIGAVETDFFGIEPGDVQWARDYIRENTPADEADVQSVAPTGDDPFSSLDETNPQ